MQHQGKQECYWHNLILFREPLSRVQHSDATARTADVLRAVNRVFCSVAGTCNRHVEGAVAGSTLQQQRWLLYRLLLLLQ
jgi:hypothetical protein